MPFQYFLAVPRLIIDAKQTLVRFTPEAEELHSTLFEHEMSDIVDALVHYTFLQSGRKILLDDLQGTLTLLNT